MLTDVFPALALGVGNPPGVNGWILIGAASLLPTLLGQIHIGISRR